MTEEDKEQLKKYGRLLSRKEAEELLEKEKALQDEAVSEE
jgi:hypothetical protein